MDWRRNPNTHPVLTTAQNRNNVFSDYYVEDGSFLRLRNLQLGYTLPSKWTQKLKWNPLQGTWRSIICLPLPIGKASTRISALMEVYYPQASILDFIRRQEQLYINVKF